MLWALAPACTNGGAPSSSAPARPAVATHPEAAPRASATTASPPASAGPAASAGGALATRGIATAPPQKVEVKESAMGTHLTFIAFTTEAVAEDGTRAAIARAVAEIRRLEALMSEWRSDSEIGRMNAAPGEWVPVSPETLDVLQKSLWASNVSNGVFDITFQAMSGLWKFGGAMDAAPKPPTRAQVASAKKLVDFRKIELDAAERRVRIGAGQSVGLGGIAKGYIVDRAARVLKDAGLRAFLVQAGGDLYGAGHKPDGSRWVSGIQDPRGAQGQFFATLELEDHAFSTAGDYARSFVSGGKRYHHIIDPRTGYPATACRSVTVWAPDAFVADAVDDAVFILGPKLGLKLVESLEDVGAVIVDQANHVHVSRRLEGKVRMLSEPTPGI